MARRTIVEITDDISGEPDAREVRFGLDGVEYEIDLGEKKAAELREGLAPFIATGRRLPQSVARNSRLQPVPRRDATTDAEQRRTIRRWWSENWRDAGLPEPGGLGRGRIPEKVVKAYASQRVVR
ncbi:Lsr2 family protein [Micromonospora sp. NPDC005652]|uniref:histone-like nucleoid-structuring protein Lsr2 n=1 Tax=Micromonospora sp. NPDC005652 TaxID=3157046 RepID=UPI003405B66F